MEQEEEEEEEEDKEEAHAEEEVVEEEEDKDVKVKEEEQDDELGGSNESHSTKAHPKMLSNADIIRRMEVLNSVGSKESKQRYAFLSELINPDVRVWMVAVKLYGTEVLPIALMRPVPVACCTWCPFASTRC
jgi:hypothetical protein